jgi:anti-sigma B factor antagonist
MKPLAQLDVHHDGDVLVAAVDGEVDISNAAELEAALTASLANDALGIVLDLSRTTYIDSAGVHFLFGLGARLSRRRQQLRLVVGDESKIWRVLKLTGVSWTLQQDGDVDDSLRNMRAEVRRSPDEAGWLSGPGPEPWY